MAKITRVRSFYFIVYWTVVAFAMVGCGGGSGSTPAPRPSATPTPSPSPTPTATPSPTPTSPDITITINPSGTKSISPWIYGINFYTKITDAPPHLTLDRMGGNRWTAYNWENNASNAGSDWHYQSDAYLGGGDTPAEAIRPIVAEDRSLGMASLMTVQLQGYVSADKNSSLAINPAQYPTYLSERFNRVVAKKSTVSATAFTETPDLTDDYVFMDEFLWAMNQKVPGGIFAAGADVPTFISLDNEPDLWHATHEEIQGPTVVTPDALIDKTIDMATALKDQFPGVQIFGAVHYGFNGIVTLQGAYTGSDWFTDKFLQDVEAASDLYGARLVDVYDIHWYSEARGGGARITTLASSSLTDAQVQAIVQSPRSLWDATYREDSWIANDYFNGPIYLLPRLQTKIDAHSPGTKLAVTEYQNGGWNHIAGTIAQADNLGIFGAQGIFAANFWPPGDSGTYPYALGAFRAFRGFDGANAHFGDTSIQATSSDVAKVVVYVSSDSTTPGRIVLVAINRSTSPHLVALNGLPLAGTAYKYQITAQSAAAQVQGSNPVAPVSAGQETVSGSSWEVALPPLSVSTIEVR